MHSETGPNCSMTGVSTYGEARKSGEEGPQPRTPTSQPKPHKAENSEEPGGGPLPEGGGGREREGEGEGEAGERASAGELWPRVGGTSQHDPIARTSPGP